MMPVIVEHEKAEEHRLPGIRHRTVASRAQGLEDLEIWWQVLDPGAETPVHRHDCEETVTVLQGSGRIDIEGESLAVEPESTVSVKTGAIHQLVNTGDEPMWIIAALAKSPPAVLDPEGETIPVPWLEAGGKE